MSNDSHGSGGRWWEIQGGGQPEEDEGGYRELMTDSRGRSRPERSLSVGADLADEPRQAARTFLWSIVSAVAALGLILSVVYVLSSSKSSAPQNAMAAPPAPPNSAPGNVEPRPPGEGGRPAEPPAQPPTQSPAQPPAQSPAQPPAQSPALPGPPPSGGDDTRPPARPPADAPPRSPAVPPGGLPSNPGPVGPPGGDPGGTGEGSGHQPAETPPPSAPAPHQETAVKLDGPAPAKPKSAQVTALKADTGGGCTKNSSDDSDYACTITRAAYYFLPETKDPRGPLGTGQAPFRCQSDGSKYSVARRVNHWWAWLTVGMPFGRSVGVWIPVVFLKGAPSDDDPIPGLPLCDGATESTR